MKIGIFGGSFNPPHKSHLNISIELLQNKIVDKVIFVPNIYNPLGKQSIDPKHRLNMLGLMTRDIEGLEVSDIEIKKNIQSYTYQTLDEFKKIYCKEEIYLIIGSDNLRDFYKWMEYEYILNTYKIIVVKRDSDDIYELMNSNTIKKYKDNIIPFNLKCNLDISSTAIRELLNEAKDISKLVSKNTYEYIIKNKLYQ